MHPTIATLLRSKGETLEITLPAPRGSGTGIAVYSDAVVLAAGSGGGLKLSSGTGADSGMWVHYLPGRANYGLAGAGQTWAASGPFSGCHIAVGLKGSQVFVAHIAKDNSEDGAESDWSKRGWRDEKT